MIKKIFVGTLIALVLVVGVLGYVNSAQAQEMGPQGETTEPIAVQEQETLALEYEHQNGDQLGDGEPIRTQTRLRELEEGECTGDCEPQQLRLQEGDGDQGVMQQQQQQLGECTGECDPQQMRQNGVNGGQGVMQQQSLCDGDTVQNHQRNGRP